MTFPINQKSSNAKEIRAKTEDFFLQSYEYFKFSFFQLILLSNMKWNSNYTRDILKGKLQSFTWTYFDVLNAFVS